jgi:hypothetical protein
MLFGQHRKPRSVLGDQSLVRRDDGLAIPQRSLDGRKCRLASTAHQFHETVDPGIVGQRQRIFRPIDPAQIDTAFLTLERAETATTLTPRPQRADSALL